ncbi:NAD(P)H-dependent oxidoreductase [uncultured Tateyamaria sp.]|uniref:NAD(P)H-dependent oxidoreductase n=1 Tax=Tateyamaria sp. 1078 TaxID=3417464 RepID=UPI002604C79F|nr:NAD(P)H-dependent oxidoreductase [uncultured Tateyamaria sp.]
MTPKRITVLDGHPGANSLSRLFTDTYAQAAQDAGHHVRVVRLSDLEFDMDFGDGGYTNWKPLEPQIEAVLKDLEWADHVVMAAPIWWGGLPAKLKGLIDRILLPGRAYDTRNLNKLGMPSPMLTGKTGRIILTSDSPRWFMRLAYGSAILRQLTGQVFGFVGIKPTRFTYFAGASHPKPGLIDRWTAQVQKIGAQAV